MATEKYAAIWDQSAALLQKGRALDLIHTRISLDFALRLLREMEGDPRIVLPAIMLHDIGNTAIKSDNLEQKTVNPGTDASKKSYSLELKQLHLTEGRKLARRILQGMDYSPDLTTTIADIVGDHESLLGGPPEDREDPNKVIVSEADKLYRFSAHGFYAMCRIHHIPEEEMLQLNYRKKNEWLCTEGAKRIADEEMRKIPGAEAVPELLGRM